MLYQIVLDRHYLGLMQVSLHCFGEHSPVYLSILFLAGRRQKGYHFS